MLIRLIILLLLTVIPTLIHGRMTYRWGVSPELQQSENLVDSLPKQLADWNYVKEADPLSPSVIAELGVSKYISRIYAKGDTAVTLLFMAGKTGRLVRHTPDICYAASGNTFLKNPTTVTLNVDQHVHELKVLPIRSGSNLSGEFVVVYGFASGGEFQSPARPRLTYHGLAAIEKIQVLCNTQADKLGEIPEYAKPFIEELCRYISSSQK